MPSASEWFANLDNLSTKRAYEKAVGDFIRFTGIVRPEEFRTVTRAHVIACRDDLAHRESTPRSRAKPKKLDGSTVRHRLAALSSLFEYLCEKNAVTHNPVKGVKRPRAESGEGKTAAIGDHQARELLAAPNEEAAVRDFGIDEAAEPEDGQPRRRDRLRPRGKQVPARAANGSIAAMSEGGADLAIVDLGEVIEDKAELNTLVLWGASYLRAGDEDSLIRCANLSLEYRDLIYRQSRARGRKLSFWQARLYALALTTAAIRARGEVTGEGHVRH